MLDIPLRRSGVLETVRHDAAAFSELCHHLLVEPDVHFRRAIELTLVTELLSKLLASAEATVELEQLHQIDNRFSPIQFLFLRVGELLDDVLDLLARERLDRR